MFPCGNEKEYRRRLIKNGCKNSTASCNYQHFCQQTIAKGQTRFGSALMSIFPPTMLRAF